MTPEEIRTLNAEMAEGVIAEVGEALQAVGCCHGHDIEATPPMFYPEMILCAVAAAYKRGLAAPRPSRWRAVLRFFVGGPDAEKA